MPITNASKPTTSVVNTERVSFAELWSTITTTWAAETRTWLDVSSLINNANRTTSTVTNVAKPA